ncbi:hypothetical protein JCGZ_19486 [Jatropha curcas]|uniref:Uncharacterized protein n=1 Tax=Jatropha curcas TaxID=180498 RepID=A0A067L889_JATCU|nr:hypothetical protein JCGZ_19486 [Jatropha curcas]
MSCITPTENVVAIAPIGGGRGRGYNGGPSPTTTSKRYARDTVAFAAKRQATPRRIGIHINETARMTTY